MEVAAAAAWPSGPATAPPVAKPRRAAARPHHAAARRLSRPRAARPRRRRPRRRTARHSPRRTRAPRCSGPRCPAPARQDAEVPPQGVDRDREAGGGAEGGVGDEAGAEEGTGTLGRGTRPWLGGSAAAATPPPSTPAEVTAARAVCKTGGSRNAAGRSLRSSRDSRGAPCRRRCRRAAIASPTEHRQRSERCAGWGLCLGFGAYARCPGEGFGCRKFSSVVQFGGGGGWH